MCCNEYVKFILSGLNLQRYSTEHMRIDRVYHRVCVIYFLIARKAVMVVFIRFRNGCFYVWFEKATLTLSLTMHTIKYKIK